ncbi:Anaphase-promoting complex subunit [Quillaja saponaria]|uniref:Anaphase-promoting complex subunit n=1 Tax=Quillaja saponaria TaxID=32244 RepID=A0AAD7KTM9_QUISA|nr:Anaphase-promoting complex subunit [Quillaja saponaria]
MLQFPAYMTQYPCSTKTIPPSFLLPSQWPQPHNEELVLATEESDFEEKCNEIRKTNSILVVIGKTTVDNDKEDFDNDADDTWTMQRNLGVKSLSKKLVEVALHQYPYILHMFET